MKKRELQEISKIPNLNPKIENISPKSTLEKVIDRISDFKGTYQSLSTIKLPNNLKFINSCVFNYKMKPKRQKFQDEKLKPLLPSMRTKKRFLKIKIKSNHKFTYKEFSSQLLRTLFTFLGFIDFGKSQIWILQNTFNYDLQTCIIKANIKTYKKILGILAIITDLKGNSNSNKS